MYARTIKSSNGRQNGDVRYHMTQDFGHVSGESLRSDSANARMCSCGKELSDTHTNPQYTDMLKDDVTSSTHSAGMLHVCPRGLRSRVICFFVVFVPMALILAVAAVLLLKAKKDWDWLEQRNRYVEEHLLHLVNLIIDFNTERECTVLHVTAREGMSEEDAYRCMTSSRMSTDSSLHAFAYVWPGRETDGYMYKSKIMFKAVLERHRELITTENDFKDELKFYTDIIHTLCGWFMRDSLIWKDTQIWPYLSSYSYLLNSIKLLGAEQTLCSVYYSIICFSHRETFLYANYSFSGEAVFKLYRLSYPATKTDTNWIHEPHSRIFPNLNTCRVELLSYVNYPGVAIDPSMCDYARKNETRVHDLDILISTENENLAGHIRTELLKESQESTLYFSYILAFSTGMILYFFLVHLIRCSIIKCHQSNHKNKWRSKDLSVLGEDEKLAHVSLNDQPTVIGYDDYRGYDESSLTPYIKVATV